MDYRNLPFKFTFGGLDIVSAPENIPQGKWARLHNVRYRRDGTLEARPGGADFRPLYNQPNDVDPVNFPYLYPDDWNVGPLVAVHYIGKIYDGVTPVDGWLTIHVTNSGTGGSGNTKDYRVFVNGVAVTGGGCNNLQTFVALSPMYISIVRGTAKTGIPIVLIDGAYYLINKDVNLQDAYGFSDNSYDIGNYTVNAQIARAYKIGITAPTVAPSVSAISTGSGGLDGTYEYAYSYYNGATGFESALSPSTSITVSPPTTDAANFTYFAPSSDTQVDTIRLWRKGGTLSTSWRLITTFANPSCGEDVLPPDYDDEALDQEIAVNERFDTDTIAPFSTIDLNGTAITEQYFRYNWGPFLGKYYFWVGDPVRRGQIYWNKAGDISRYNPLTSTTTVADHGEDLQNGFIFSSVPFVFSTLNLYALDYGGVDALPEFTSRLIPIGVGLAARWCFAVAPNAVFFLGKDGVYATDCQPGSARNITEDALKPIFQGRSVGDIEAIKWSDAEGFRMFATNKELHWFYVGLDTGTYQHLVYDFERGAWSQWTKNNYFQGYFDEGSPSPRMLFGNTQGNVGTCFYIDDSTPDASEETFDVRARTGSIDNDIPLTYKEYGALQLDADLDSTTVTVTPVYNSEVVDGTEIEFFPDSGDGRRDYPKSLGDYYARSIALQFEWTEAPGTHPILYQGNLLFRDEEERLIHWEQPPSALGNGGWFHIKDGWICLRSESTVILTVVIDGEVTDTYNLASTGGEKKKIYVEFKPRRGKLFQFKLDSTPTFDDSNQKPFRFYGDETIIFGKPWITGATYQQIANFGPVGYAQYRRTEGGT